MSLPEQRDNEEKLSIKKRSSSLESIKELPENTKNIKCEEKSNINIKKILALNKTKTNQKEKSFYNYPINTSKKIKFFGSTYKSIILNYPNSNISKVNLNKKTNYLPSITNTTRIKNIENFYLTVQSKESEEKKKNIINKCMVTKSANSIFNKKKKSLDNETNIYLLSEINNLRNSFISNYSYLDQVNLYRTILKNQMINRHKFQHSQKHKYIFSYTKEKEKREKDLNRLITVNNEESSINPAKNIFYNKAPVDRMTGYEKIYINFSNDDIEKNVTMKKEEKKNKLKKIQLVLPNNIKKHNY